MLKPVSVFGLCIVAIAGLSVPVWGQQQLAVTQPAGKQAKTFTFDGNESLTGWTFTGDVTIDMTKGREGGSGSLKVGPGSKALLKLRDRDESGRVEFWVYDDGTKPDDPKAHRLGPRWGLMQRDGKVLAAGILYANYLGGDEGYTATACDGQDWFNELFWLGVKRTPAGWHKWTFDFDPEAGLQVLHNDREVNALDSGKTGLKGFSVFAVWGDEDKGKKQTIWLADLSVTLGGPVTVFPIIEADPYDEKTLAADQSIRRPVVIYSQDNAPSSPNLENLPLRESVSQYGITWTFERPAHVGQFVNGDWYVVGPVTIKAIEPSPLYGSDIPRRELDRMDKERPEAQRVRNGFMLNPPAQMKVAYDSGVRNWFDPSLIQKLPVTMRPGDSLVSTISMPKGLILYAQLRNSIERGVDDSSPIRTAAVLTCVSQPRPPDTFRPAFCDRRQKIYLARNLKRELLPVAAATQSMPKVRQYIRFTQRPWVGTCFFGFEEPVENMPQYGLEYGRVVGICALLLCTDLEPQQKEPLLVNFIQVGIDLGGMVRAGHPGWTAWGGHGSGRKLPIVFAGLLLGDDELANVNKSLPKVSFGEDEQTAYGDCWTGAKVVFAGHSGIDAATGEGRSRGSGWGPYEHTPPSQWKDGQNTSESYRRCCTSVGWVAQALALRLMRAEKFWNHDAFFDYVDRWMYEDDAAFVKAIKEATGRDHDKEWARQGQAWDAFVNGMWAEHRPTLPAPTDGWRQKHDDSYYRTAIAEQSGAPPGAATLGLTKLVINEKPTAGDIAPASKGDYKWFSGQWWYSEKPPRSKYSTQNGVLAISLGGDLVSTSNDFSTGKIPLLPGRDGFYVEFDYWLSDTDPDHFPAVWLMPAEHNGARLDRYPGDAAGYERWMELDVDEGGFGPGLTGTVHSHYGIYEGGYQQIQNPNNVSAAALDRSQKHTFGASYDPRNKTVTWWVDGVKHMSTGSPYVPDVGATQNFYLIIGAQSHGKQKPYSMFVSGVRAYVPPNSLLPAWKQKHDGAYHGAAIAEQSVASLPPGVKAVWDLSKAHRETTPTRERICINGLWRWQPASNAADKAPADGWGYFKVPGCWPGITDYMQKDNQTVHAHPSWRDQKPGDITAAWYEREITIPTHWAGRHIAVCIEYLNSYAVVSVDGTRAGETRFPGGEVDLTSMCHAGGTHRLSLLVVALPLKGVMLSYTDTASAREVKGSVARRGLCGDVYLVSTPPGPRIADVRVDTSVRKWELMFDAALQGLDADRQYAMHAQIADNGRNVGEFTSKAFKVADLKDGRIAFSEKWKPDKLWDIHTPQNTYYLEVSLLDAGGKVLDVLPAIRFGFREFWIDGRDFYLNGSRIFLSAVPLDNAQVGAALANYEAARESMERLKSFGINFVYTHNYGCEPGSHLGFAEILRAADDVGMLVSFSQPHFSHYDWQAADADQKNGYARHAEFYVRAAQNHPSVVMYSTSHNATGYNEDMNPGMIDGIQDARDTWALRNVKLALRAEDIVKHLDPYRIVYHHASGNLGSMHAINFYPNFVPIQEMSDWFEHWATKGVKPVFMCEYGAPFTWDWAMYRGWYKGKREFGSAPVPWEFCLAEWNAQFFGDRAFQISEMEKRNLRWEAKQFREGKLWHRWDYPHQLGSTDFPERELVFGKYYTDNWRAFRTWGVSANSPWEHHILFKLRPGMERNRREDIKVDWVNLQRPGFSPDYKEERYERMDLAYERSDWIPTAGAQALIRNNRPLLAYIGGKTACFTSKDHLFVAGETVEKQLIVINNSRVPVSCDCSWSLALPQPIAGQSKVTVETGQQARIPMRFTLPAGVRPGEYKLSANAVFNNGQIQEDEFIIHVLPRWLLPRAEVKVAMFDPKGETTELLKGMGVRCDTVDAKADLGAYEVLIVGKAALTVDGPAPDIGRVRDGLKVLVFEQTPDVLEKRFGFRVAEYGLRNVFRRVPDHPALAGLQTEHLRDWRGEATILPPRLKYELNPKFNYAPTVTWCGIPVTRAWRCGCRGNVASVLIEKPTCGDFLPIVDGGFSLQYSPLLEYREGDGTVLFCQMDVTGRTETEPAAQTLTANILEYVSAWKPSPRREALYIGEPAGMAHLQAVGLRLGSYGGGELKADQVLIVGPGSKGLAAHRGAVGTFLKAGGHLLAIGLIQEDADALLPFKVSINQAEHINAYFDPPGANSLLAGVGPADVHNRDPRTTPLVSGGANTVGDGVLAVASGDNVVFCQLAPWQFEYRNNFGLKRTFRRTSFLLTRLLGNLGVSGETPLLTRLSTPVGSNEHSRWLQGFYLDGPEEWDDPYRFFRW